MIEKICLIPSCITSLLLLQFLLIDGHHLPWIFNGSTSKGTWPIQAGRIAQETNQPYPALVAAIQGLNFYDLLLYLAGGVCEGFMSLHVGVDPHSCVFTLAFHDFLVRNIILVIAPGQVVDGSAIQHFHHANTHVD